MFAVGNVPVAALARLLETLGAGESGDTHVVVTDVREELVVYINGMPYIRRELEMPAAAMHHAGVHARQLETLEMALKEVRPLFLCCTLCTQVRFLRTINVSSRAGTCLSSDPEYVNNVWSRE